MIKKIIKAISNPRLICLYLLDKYAHLIKNDATFLKIKFRLRMGHSLNLETPKTFSEKLQWLKLYDRKPIYTTMVDKYETKKYVAEIIGNEYIIPTLGIFDRVEDIDFDSLPNQFVLKCTHDSGGVVICRGKDHFDIESAKKYLNTYLHRSFFWENREWPYKNVKPRIIAEKYMEDIQTGELRDYKFFCFNGVVRALFIATERQSNNEETKFDFFDTEFNHLNIKNGHPNALHTPSKPHNFELMKELARKLSEGIPHARIDFYEVNGHVYFGEITFFHWSGMTPFEPCEWDYKFGDWISLPSVL